MLKTTLSIRFILFVLMLSSLACLQSAALSSSSPTPTDTPTKPALTMASQAPEPTVTERARSCLVIAQEALNLRSGAGVSFRVIGWLSPGERLTLTTQPAQGSWIQVTTESNQTGWINSKYCTKGK